MLFARNESVSLPLIKYNAFIISTYGYYISFNIFFSHGTSNGELFSHVLHSHGLLSTNRQLVRLLVLGFTPTSQLLRKNRAMPMLITCRPKNSSPKF